MIFLLVGLCAFWFMFLIATLVETGLAMVLGILPVGIPLLMNAYAMPILLLASLVALFGNACQLSEILVNKNTSRDVSCMFGGAVVVLMVFLTLPQWPLFVGKGVFALLTLFYPAATFSRALMDRTDTIFSSILLVLLSLATIAALTYVMV